MEKLHCNGDRIQLNTLFLYPGSRCCHCPITQFVLRFLNCLSCGRLGQYLEKKRYQKLPLTDHNFVELSPRSTEKTKAQYVLLT